MRSFQAAGCIENNLEATDLEDTEDEDNADELGESGGMRARPQPRKLSTQEVEADMIDHYPFRSWCRYCVMAASRSDHHRRQAEDYDEVPVISCDYVFFTDSRDHEERQLTEAAAIAVGAAPILVIRDKRSKIIHATVYAAKELRMNFQFRQRPSGFFDWVILK